MSSGRSRGSRSDWSSRASASDRSWGPGLPLVSAAARGGGGVWGRGPRGGRARLGRRRRRQGARRGPLRRTCDQARPRVLVGLAGGVGGGGGQHLLVDRDCPLHLLAAAQRGDERCVGDAVVLDVVQLGGGVEDLERLAPVLGLGCAPGEGSGIVKDISLQHAIACLQRRTAAAEARACPPCWLMSDVNAASRGLNAAPRITCLTAPFAAAITASLRASKLAGASRLLGDGASGAAMTAFAGSIAGWPPSGSCCAA
jgi:hypothetical protein